MTISSKFFTTEVQFNIVSSKKQFPAWLCSHVFICMCVNVVCSKYSSLSKNVSCEIQVWFGKVISF